MEVFKTPTILLVLNLFLAVHQAGLLRRKEVIFKAAFISITVILVSLYLLQTYRIILGNDKEVTQRSLVFLKQGLHKEET